MHTQQTRFNEALLDLILIERLDNPHEGYECGMGFCTAECHARVTIDCHNDAVLFLRSLHGVENA